MKSHKRDVDGGWAWLALVAVYGGMLTLSTVMYTSGVLYVEMLEYYREDAAKTSVIGALNTGLMCLLGVGNALASVPLALVLVHYFEKHRNVVLALSQVVIGIAMFIASPLALWLLREYGLKGTLLITSGLSAHIFVCAIVCKPSSSEIDSRKRTLPLEETALKEKSTICVCVRGLDLDAFKSLPFICFLISTTTWNFMLSVCLMHLPNYVITKGLDESHITVMMTIFSITNTVGRFGAVFVVDNVYIDNFVVHIGCLGIAGIITMSFASFDHLPFAEYAFAGAIGIFTGLPSALVTPMTLSLVDFGRISKAHGLVNFFSGLGYVTGPPIAVE
ncbi:MOT12-like protein [Mya arenaria]|uniref:MOT12-like protein n=1 Tax=Mya arenaria TaxID=6604 RepID=A0ABY7G697_MYAAR|nr:MOT12-like protein [Mya arenaria]